MDVFYLLYKAMERSKLEYANSVWNPHRKEVHNNFRKVQIRATKLVKSTKVMRTNKKLGIPTLKYTRMRRDLIEVLKIITAEDCNGNCNIFLHKGLATRGIWYKWYQKHVNYALSKYFATELLHSGTACLHDNVVSFTSINMFKNKLDKFLHDQDI